MSSDSFAELERKLGLTLPPDYRRFLEDYPGELRAALAATMCEGYVIDDPWGVMMLNLAVRRGPFYGIGWPDEYLAIGSDDFGNFYCLDLTQSPSPVLFFDHELGDFEQEATSINEWWPRLVRELQG